MTLTVFNQVSGKSDQFNWPEALLLTLSIVYIFYC